MLDKNNGNLPRLRGETPRLKSYSRPRDQAEYEISCLRLFKRNQKHVSESCDILPVGRGGQSLRCGWPCTAGSFSWSRQPAPSHLMILSQA
jgi:hypothetical protein